MGYKALYRTYRPQTFREVVGQEVIVKTLQNAIANNKISHAYLLSGPRGTGKTTIARIFAKTLNCDHVELNEPCNKCVSCYEISDSNSPDVIEIDAASNNGVDEIREIREKVKFLPSGTKYKIYIIDEVHMLSTGAFNALLKTLEEPPKHVIFILATTEPQKLPATIISRCQRFDFKALSVGDITHKLRTVCSEEGFNITEEALNAISEAAEGGLRDALSIMDQAISYCDEEVSIEEVNLVTGNLSYDKLIELATFFNTGDVNGALETTNELIDLGKEVPKLVGGLLQFYRDMLLFKNVDSPVYSKYIFEKEKFKELAQNTAIEKIFYYIDVLSDVQMKIKYSQTPRIYLEIAIIKLINMSSGDLDFIKRIQNVETRLENIQFSNIESFETPIDNEKINSIDTRLNRVVTELSKLELHKLTQRVNDLESGRITTTEKGGVSIDVEKQIAALQETILLFKTSYNNLKNQVENIIKDEDDNSMQDIVRRLESIEKQTKNSITQNIENEMKYIQEDLDAIKLIISKQSKPKEIYTNEDASTLKEKINMLEKQVYALLSNQASPKAPTTSKKAKIPGEQIVLFSDDLTPIQNFEKTKEKENVDFKELSKNEEETIDEPFDQSDEEIVDEYIDKKEVTQEEKQSHDEQKKLNEDFHQISDRSVKESEEQHTIAHSSREEKPKSQLVISNSRDVDLFERERQLMDREMQSIRPSTIASKQKQPQETNEALSFHSEISRFSSYDIKHIENIMHDARTEQSRMEMGRLSQFWERIGRITGPEAVGIVDVLKDGKLGAVGSKEFIIIYKTSMECNQVMRASFKERALKLLRQNLGEVFNYVALPEHIWNDKRREYKEQYNIGIKYPSLSKIEDPDLIIIDTKADYKDPKEKIVDKTIEFFGSDIVKVE